MKSIVYLFFLLGGSSLFLTAEGPAAPPFDPNAAFPMPNDKEMAEFTQFLESLDKDPEFQKIFNDIMNDPELDQILNTPPSAPLKVAPSSKPEPAGTGDKEKSVEAQAKEEVFQASADWRINFLHNFDMAQTLPAKDAKKTGDDEFSFFKKKSPEGPKKPKVKIPTSLKSAYAKFAYSLGSSVVHIKRIIASGSLGAHGRDQLEEFNKQGTDLLTVVFKTSSKTVYLRELYLSSVDGRRRMLDLHDEFERVAKSISLRDEEEDDFDDRDVATFKKNQKTVAQLKDFVSKMKNMTTEFNKILDLSKEALELKRKEREERAKKQAESAPRGRDSFRSFGSSSGSSSGWDHRPSSHRSSSHRSDWGGGSSYNFPFADAYGGDFGRTPTGSGYGDYDDHHPVSTAADKPATEKAAASPVSYPSGSSRSAASDESKKTLADIKARLLVAMNNPLAKTLKKYLHAKPLTAEINKFYLENESPESLAAYATQIKGLEGDAQRLDLMARGELDNLEELLSGIQQGDKEPARKPKPNKEAAELLKQWNAHLKDVYQASTNLALQATEMPNRSNADVIALPLLETKVIKQSEPEALVRTTQVYRGLESLRACVKAQVAEEAKKIDAARKKAIVEHSKFKDVVTKARNLAKKYKDLTDLYGSLILDANSDTSSAFSARGRISAQETAALRELFDFQDDILAKHITPFTWEYLHKDMQPLFDPPASEDKLLELSADIAQQIAPAVRSPEENTNRVDKIRLALRFWYQDGLYRGARVSHREADASDGDDEASVAPEKMAYTWREGESARALGRSSAKRAPILRRDEDSEELCEAALHGADDEEGDDGEGSTATDSTGALIGRVLSDPKAAPKRSRRPSVGDLSFDGDKDASAPKGATLRQRKPKSD